MRRSKKALHRSLSGFVANLGMGEDRGGKNVLTRGIVGQKEEPNDLARLRTEAKEIGETFFSFWSDGAWPTACN